MKTMLDTNVIISALVFGERTGRLLNMLFESEHELYVSEYIDQEFKEKLMKWILFYLAIKILWSLI